MILEKITLKELQLLKSHPNTQIKINTPTGYEIISDVYEKESEGLHILFSDNTELRCSLDHLVYHTTSSRATHKQSWKPCKSLVLNDIFYDEQTQGYKKIIKISPISVQKWLDFTIEAEHSSYYHEGILHHNSGKSHMIYLIMRFILEYTNHRIMIIVPSIGLVEQMYKDFLSYVKDDYNIDKDIHRITAGKDKFSDKRIVITTYQSLLPLFKNDGKYDVEEVEDFFYSFQTLVIDETHKAENLSISKIINAMPNTQFRLGFSGTLKDSKCHILQLTGLLGEPYIATTSKELQESGVQSELDIKINILKYSDDDINYLHSSCKSFNGKKSSVDYHKEIEFILGHKKRNELIVRNLLKQSNNVLGLYNFHSHGDLLKELLETEIEKQGLDKKVVFIHGKVKLEDREDIRQELSEKNNIILLATYACLQEGFNAPNIHAVMFLHPYKGKIRNLQSIGRGLRRIDGIKEHIVLYDIGDDLTKTTKSGKKSTVNHTLKHLYERIGLYDDEGFKYKINNIKL